MVLGTAGFTAGLCFDALQKHDVAPDSGDVVVTGASGGVGTFAVALLAKLGYHVTAVTGKASSHEYLKRLGAEQILGREQVDDRSGKPLLSRRWAGPSIPSAATSWGPSFARPGTAGASPPAAWPRAATCR